MTALSFNLADLFEIVADAFLPWPPRTRGLTGKCAREIPLP
ncbi:MAG: hypothetical protein JWN52_2733 [Actinomycetia bacterium]|nr:hypothetical protein [Actinomycetes bacterium]